jgi:hypothetical protein
MSDSENAPEVILDEALSPSMNAKEQVESPFKKAKFKSIDANHEYKNLENEAVTFTDFNAGELGDQQTLDFGRDSSLGVQGAIDPIKHVNKGSFLPMIYLIYKNALPV